MNREFHALAAEGVATEAIVAARENAHWAAQLVSAAGQALAEPRADGGHLSMRWDPAEHQLVGVDLGRAVREEVRLGLHLESLSLRIMGASVLDSLPLAGKTFASARSWLDRELGRLLGREVALTRPDLRLPYHPISAGAPFQADPDALSELTRWLCATDRILARFRLRYPDLTDARCWPERFDVTATLPVEIEAWSPADDAPVLSFGMTPGDRDVYPPYYYVSPWPTPSKVRDLAPLAHGHWNDEGWCGAALTARELRGLTSAEQLERVLDFFEAARLGAREIRRQCIPPTSGPSFERYSEPPL